MGNDPLVIFSDRAAVCHGLPCGCIVATLLQATVGPFFHPVRGVFIFFSPFTGYNVEKSKFNSCARSPWLLWWAPNHAATPSSSLPLAQPRIPLLPARRLPPPHTHTLGPADSRGCTSSVGFRYAGQTMRQRRRSSSSMGFAWRASRSKPLRHNVYLAVSVDMVRDSCRFPKCGGVKEEIVCCRSAQESALARGGGCGDWQGFRPNKITKSQGPTDRSEGPVPGIGLGWERMPNLPCQCCLPSPPNHWLA